MVEYIVAAILVANTLVADWNWSIGNRRVVVFQAFAGGFLLGAAMRWFA